MAKSRKLDPIHRRNLLWSPRSSPGALKAAGHEHLEEGADYEALQFFLRAGDEEDFRSLLSRSVERGDVFLLAQIDHLRKDMVTAEHYAEAAARAESLDKFRYAAWGYEKAGDEAGKKRAEDGMIGAVKGSDPG